MKTRWVLKSKEEKDDETNEPLYWNNDEGWTLKENADRYSTFLMKRFCNSAFYMQAIWEKI